MPGLVHQFVGEALHVVTAGPGIDHVGDAGFFLQVDLGVAGDARRKIAWAAQSLHRARWCAAIACGPSTAASASMHVRGTLLKTSCAVRLQPEVWQCVRRAIDLGFFAD